jgi:hypothetical protein
VTDAPPPAPVGVALGGVDVVVLGGGVLGAAVARVATAGGARVTVGSRTQRPQVGWWRRFELEDKAFPAWIPRDVRVVVALGPAPAEAPAKTWGAAMVRLVGGLARGGRPVTLCGPIGDDAFEGVVRGVMEARVLRFAPLFAVEDRVTQWAATSLREGRRVRVPSGLPRSAPLWAEDAARVVLSGAGDELTLRGPEVMEVGAVLDALVLRYGGVWQTGWVGAPWTASERRRAAAAAEAPDVWDDSRFGPRLPFASWADRLPGPRRRR